MKIPTIKIKSGSKAGFAVINKADFDDKKHEIYTPKPAPKPKKKAKPKPKAKK